MKWMEMVWSSYAMGLRIGGLMVLATAVLLGTACFSRQDAQSPDSGQVLLACSESCQARGQCGTAVDGSTQILSSSIGPAVDGHDLLFAVDTQATINRVITRTLTTPNLSQPFDLPFYLVALPDGRQGWVAEWCVAPIQ